jgi:hypothetical protein
MSDDDMEFYNRMVPQPSRPRPTPEEEAEQNKVIFFTFWFTLISFLFVQIRMIQISSYLFPTSTETSDDWM